MPDRRGSRQARGYGAEWERLRLEILARDDYLCQCARCAERGATRLATEVDHIVPKDKALALGWSQVQIDDQSNLQAINEHCHDLKSKEERGMKSIERISFSRSGWPVWQS